jgi:hypothetical protein
MNELMRMFLHLFLENLFKITVEILASLDSITEIQEGLPRQTGFLMVILDLDVDQMDRLVQLAPSTKQIIAHRIKAALLTGDHHIRYAHHTVLPPLWR